MQEQAIGYRAMMAAVSDVAAMGAGLTAVYVGLALGPDWDEPAVEALYDGFAEALSHVGASSQVLAGGDLVAAPNTVLCLTVVGTLDPQALPGFRHTARPGDQVAVTGPHGLAALGLWALQNQATERFPQAWQAHQYPLAQVKMAQQISHYLGVWQQSSPLPNDEGRYALMDTSDGLADAALKLAQASQVAIVLEESALHPLPAELQHAQAHDGLDAMNLVLYGGEDFELLLCAPPAALTRLQHQGILLTRVGRVEANPAGSAWLETLHQDRHPLHFDGCFQHFAVSPSATGY